ncbi:MAG: fibronectin type III domain-containing protein, partial [Nitrospirota bacterium]
LTTTNSNGTTSTIFTLGTKTGTSYTVIAKVNELTATFTATATYGTPTYLTGISGDGQKATVTITLTPYVVKVTDTYGNPVGSYSITWQIIEPGYGAKLSATLTTTNGNGTTSTIFTLGTKTGTYTVIAKVNELVATFTATATYGTPTYLTGISGDGQKATVTTTLTPYAVKVTDTYGNPVGSYSVIWQIIEPGYGAKLSATSTTTNGNGTTSTIFTLGTRTGAYTVIAKVNELTATFTATAIYGTPTYLTGISGAGQKATVTITLTPYAVKVTDTYGNPVGSYSVTWQIIEPGYGANLSATLTTTNDTGTTSTIFTLGTKTGAYTVIAKVNELTATFTATATYGTLTSLTIVSGDNQKATVTTTLTPFIVQLTDTYGNPIGSYSVTWQIIEPGYGANLSATLTTTNGNGTTSTIFTLGTKTGIYTVIAKVNELVATFTATAPFLTIFPENKTVILGATFTLQINLSDIPDFDAVGVYLSFDPQILEVISLTQGTFPSGGSELISQFNNGSGTIDYAVGLTSGTAQGSGTVLTILFNPKIEGSTTVNFDFTPPRKTEILNGINPIPFAYKNGTITVGINNPPVAIISAPLRPVKVNDLVILDGTKSYDPDSNPITYYWRQIAGPQITIANPTVGIITFTPVQIGNYAFELKVTDDMGAHGSATVTVIVTDTLLTISPASIEVGIENNFNLDIVLSKAKEFDSVGMYLSFDPNILEVTKLTQGPFPQNGSVIITQFNNGSGTIDYAVGLTSGTATGTGTVLTISFKAKAITGTTTLNFNFNPPRNTDILKGTASLPFVATEGKIIIVPYGSLDGYVLFDIPRQNPHAGIEINIAGTELKATTTNTGYFLINNVSPMTYPQVFAYAPGASPRYWGSVTITAGAKTTPSTLTLLNADANGDCMVSLIDFGYLKLAFLKTNTSPGWYDSAYHKRDGYINSDFSGEGMVSLSDFGYLKLNFLKTTSPQYKTLSAPPLMQTMGRLPLPDGSALLKVVPPEKNAMSGDEFEMNIDLLHTPIFDSVGVYFSFDPQILEVISLTPGSLTQGGSELIRQFNNGSGTIDYAVGLTSGTAQGTGTVLTIKLKAKGSGTTTLNFDFNPPRNTEILNGIIPVSFISQNGTITVSLDGIPPTSTAGPLPEYSGTSSLKIPYIASDNIGLKQVSLYKMKEGGTWSYHTYLSISGTFTTGTFTCNLGTGTDGRWFFYTKAKDIANNEEAFTGSDTSVIVDTTKPVTPTLISVTNPATGGRLDFSWTPGTDTNLAGYIVHYGTQSGNYAGSKTISGTDTTYTLSTLTNGIRYYIAISAYDKAENKSDKSNELYGTPTESLLIVISPTIGTVGSIVTVSGDSFGSIELIRIDFGTTRTIAMAMANQSGTFSTTFTIDTQPYSFTTVMATGLNSGKSALNSFRILPNIILLTPKSGTVGSIVTIRGNGFGASEQITIDFGINPMIAVVFANAYGNFSTTFTVDTQGGCGTVTVSAHGSHCSAYSQFVILGQITLVTPTKGTVGSFVTVAGNGFGVIELIRIDFGITPTITTTISDANGKFITTFIVNTQPIGTTTIRAVGLFTNATAIAYFKITEDIIPPTIIHIPIISGPAGVPITIIATITDNIEVKQAILYWKIGGTKTISSALMVKIANDLYGAIIPVKDVTMRGLQYAIWATDGKNETLSTIWTTLTYGTVSSGKIGAVYPTYKSISVPVHPHNPDPANVLWNWGNFEVNVRLVHFDGANWIIQISNSSGLSSRVPNFAPEIGYGITADANKEIIVSGTSTNPSGYYVIPLKGGSPERWNNIGHPYLYPVALNENIKFRRGDEVIDPVQAYLKGWIKSSLWYYDGTGFKMVPYPGVINPWVGYFIPAGVDCEMLVPAEEIGSKVSNGNTTCPIKEWNYDEGVVSENDTYIFGERQGWTIQLMANAGSLTDEFNFVGISESAKNGYDDQNDLREIPILPIGTGLFDSPACVNLYFTSQTGGSKYACDYRGAREEEKVWEFEVERRGEKEDVELSWKIDRVPQQNYLYLKDKDTGNILDMQKINGYKFVGNKRQFSLIVTSHQIPVISTATTLESAYCYPNPTTKDKIIFANLPAGKIKVKIYNIVGEEVRDDEITRDGNNEWTWNCKNNASERVASGIYIYILQDPVSGSMKKGKLGVIR